MHKLHAPSSDADCHITYHYDYSVEWWSEAISFHFNHWSWYNALNEDRAAALPAV